MYGDLETLEHYWKQIEYVRAEADLLVSNTPCFLYAVQITAGTGGAATAIVRDGHDTSGEKVIDLSALTSSADLRRFDPPIFLKKGLFLDVASNVTSILVQFKLSRKKAG